MPSALARRSASDLAPGEFDEENCSLLFCLLFVGLQREGTKIRSYPRKVLGRCPGSEIDDAGNKPWELVSRGRIHVSLRWWAAVRERNRSSNYPIDRSQSVRRVLASMA